MPTPFLPRAPSDIAELVAAYPLCWVISSTGTGAGDRHATPLPLLPEGDAAGAVVSLLGHFARSNPQVAALERDPSAMILCTGPQAFIAPRLVSDPTWGPTWNYAVVRFDVEIAFVPEENDAALEKLAAALERGQPDPWTPDRMGARYDRLARYIVAFRATIRAVHPKFKLGQDEKQQAFDEIVAGVADPDLARWMIRNR